MFVRRNNSARKFYMNSSEVKLKLHVSRSFCLCFCDIALWEMCLRVDGMRQFCSSYNKHAKLNCFQFKYYESVTGILLKIVLFTVTTIMHNAYCSFTDK